MTKEQLNNIWLAHLEGYYDPHYFRPIIPYISSFLLNHTQLNGKLLDLGCGHGQRSDAFKEMGFNVTAIDSDAARIQKAKTTYQGIDFREYKIGSTLPFEDNSFDVVFSHSVFQYLQHEPIIRECKRILKPGGAILLIENLRYNMITITGRSFLKLIRFRYQSYPWNHFTYTEINKLRKQFQSTELQYFHFLSPLSHVKPIDKFFAPLAAIDKLILALPLARRMAWLCFFAGINHK